MSSSRSADVYHTAAAQVIYGPEPGETDSAIWASLVAALFREPALTRAGAARRLVLLFVFIAALVALLIAEIH